MEDAIIEEVVEAIEPEVTMEGPSKMVWVLLGAAALGGIELLWHRVIKPVGKKIKEAIQSDANEVVIEQ